MRTLPTFLTCSVALSCSSLQVFAAPPASPIQSRPMVVLSQQIEELPAVPEKAVVQVSQQSGLQSPPSVSEPATPRVLFPAAREFFRKMTNSSKTEERATQPVMQDRQVMTTSDLQLEPLPTEANLNAPPADLIPPSPSHNHRPEPVYQPEPAYQPAPGYRPELGYGPEPGYQQESNFSNDYAGTIYPPGNECDGCAGELQSVHPRSHKLGSRFSMPHFPKIFSKYERCRPE